MHHTLDCLNINTFLQVSRSYFSLLLYIALNLKLQTLVIRLYISRALGVQVDYHFSLALRRISTVVEI